MGVSLIYQTNNTCPVVRAKKQITMKKYTVTSSVPTGYQLNSINTLMGAGNVKSHADGSFSANIEFDSEEAARGYLRERLSDIFNETSMDESEHAEAVADIEKNGRLEYDAAVARIEITD